MTNHGGWLCHAPPTFRIRPCFGTVARFSVFFRCDCCQKCGASSSTRAKTKVEERKKRYLSLRRFGMAKVKDDAAGRMLTSRSDTRRCAPRRTVLASLDPHALNHVTDEIGSRSAQTPEMAARQYRPAQRVERSGRRAALAFPPYFTEVTTYLPSS